MAWSDTTRVLAVRWIPIVLLGMLALAYLRFAPDSLKPWTNAPQVAGEPKDPAAKIERIYIPGPERVRVIEKIKYIEKLPGVLTPQTMADNTAHVVASAQIPPGHGGTASAILRMVDNVGVGSIEYRPATPPFFAVQKEFGVRGGVGTGGVILGELYGRPVRVGPVTVEVRAYGKGGGTTETDFGAAILGDYRF